MDIIYEVVEGGFVPTKAYESASCYDLYAREMYMTDTYIGYKLGIKLDLPSTHEAFIFSRSSISNYHLQQSNAVGIVDSDFKGEIEIRFKLSPPNYLFISETTLDKDEEYKIYKVGDKVAQLLINEKTNYALVNSIDCENYKPTESLRGTKGFGSSGE